MMMYKFKKIILKEYEKECPECNGSGDFRIRYGPGVYTSYLKRCPLCNGSGVLDWIDIIKRGKNEMPNGSIKEVNYKQYIKENGKWIFCKIIK